MQSDTSKIQIKTTAVDIKASNLSEESIQAVLDFVTVNQKIQMKSQSRGNLEALAVDLFLSLVLGVGTYLLASVTHHNQPLQESQTYVK
ncbi:MAG: hypothetical protein HWQ44_16745 [Nostoc sp. JL34]|uniref:hypothetical protein n=1 Tax=Nostoc sp. JL34 TaxID=2815397 RepID=UPI001D754DF7|nr:hypothetical protein [Nostoc sp. JL34]MBN3884558.1 hypothetical protein [Nostoc sp. JL34]